MIFKFLIIIYPTTVQAIGSTIQIDGFRKTSVPPAVEQIAGIALRFCTGCTNLSRSEPHLLLDHWRRLEGPLCVRLVKAFVDRTYGTREQVHDAWPEVVIYTTDTDKRCPRMVNRNVIFEPSHPCLSNSFAVSAAKKNR
ncbi:hypothetical protein N7510_007046 [Penicillium lagena]|uniref:uncharacterized protein n=1 Tax=Penicillium lagena TaxID=94218 RepID=UPI0025422900|nr:uncharacterized protein N7510_007046 [Penicillium lagena]KAJ5610327.1 hypothetical protein N7510_007046 [Penicillium lagena]